MIKRRIALFFHLLAVTLFAFVGLLGIVAIIWIIVDIFQQSALISIEQFNKPIVISLSVFFSGQGFVQSWEKLRKAWKRKD